MEARNSINEYRKRRAQRLDEYKNSENWVTINGVHVLLDKHGNVINNFKDSNHKLKNLRFVDAVSSHTEGGKKVVDAPIGRKTHEEKFNESMSKISESFSLGTITKDDVQKRVANALANLEQGAVVNAGSMRALKLGKGLFKLKGEKGNFTAKQIAEKIAGSLKENGEGMPSVKAGTNTNAITKGSKRLSHVAKNALEDLYNKYKSNKYSQEGLKSLAKEYLNSLPGGTELTVGSNVFKKNGEKAWSIEDEGETHMIARGIVASILLHSMRLGYAGGSLNAKVPEAGATTEEKVEKAAEKIAEKEPIEKEPEKAPEEEKVAEEPKKEIASAKPMSDSLKELVSGGGTAAEKMDSITKYLEGLPDGTPISYEAVHKVTGELYVVHGTKEGDKIKFTKKEAPLHGMAKSFLKKLESGLAVGGSDEPAFEAYKDKKTEAATPEKAAEATPEKPEEKPAEPEKKEEPAEPAKPVKKFATEKMDKLAAIHVDESKYTPEKKAIAMADWGKEDHYKKVEEKHTSKSLAWLKSLPENVKMFFKSYTGGGYTAINNSLRNAGVDGLTPEERSRANQMTDAIAKSKMDEPTMLCRGLSYFTFAQMFGMSAKEVSEMVSNPEKLKETFDGSTGIENGFASCGTVKGTGFKDKQVRMEIYCPEGTEAIFANPWSSCKSLPGMGEYETILQRGTAFRITGIAYKHGRLRVKCEVVAQKLLVDNFGDDISGKLAA